MSADGLNPRLIAAIPPGCIIRTRGFTAISRWSSETIPPEHEPVAERRNTTGHREDIDFVGRGGVKSERFFMCPIGGGLK